MSIPVRVTTGRDAGIREKQGTQPFWSRQQYALGNATDNRKRIFVRFSSLAQQIRGRVVLSATLSARLKVGGNHTVTIAELTEAFDQRTKWNPTGDKPAVRSAGQVSQGVTAGNNERWSIDVTALVQRVASGTTHYGFRLSSAGVNDRTYYGFESGNAWRLDIELAEDSDAPVSLEPDGDVVGLAKPTLTWAADEGDPDGPVDGSDAQAAYQVQISTSDSTAGIAYDSGTVASAENQHVMADFAYSLPAGAARFWRVRTRDLNSVWTDWSDWAETSYVAYPSVAITSPTTEMYDPSPVVQATVSGAFLRYRVLAYRVADQRTPIYDSGRVAQTSSPITHTIPDTFNGVRVFTTIGEQYRIVVRVEDRDDRIGTPGDLGYVAAESVVTLTGGTGPAPTLLEVEPVSAASPGVRLRWSLSPTPDGFAIQRDDQITKLELADVTQRVGVWTYVDPNPTPGFHEYRVRAITNGAQGKPSNMLSVTAGVTGTWVIRDKENGGQQVCFAGAPPQFERDDSVAEYSPMEGDTLRVTYFRRNPRGAWVGYLDVRPDQDLDEALAVMDELEANPTEVVSMIWGEEAIRARLDNLLTVSADESGDKEWRKNTRLHRTTAAVRKIGKV